MAAVICLPTSLSLCLSVVCLSLSASTHTQTGQTLIYWHLSMRSHSVAAVICPPTSLSLSVVCLSLSAPPPNTHTHTGCPDLDTLALVGGVTLGGGSDFQRGAPEKCHGAGGAELKADAVEGPVATVGGRHACAERLGCRGHGQYGHVHRCWSNKRDTINHGQYSHVYRCWSNKRDNLNHVQYGNVYRCWSNKRDTINHRQYGHGYRCWSNKRKTLNHVQYTLTFIAVDQTSGTL